MSLINEDLFDESQWEYWLYNLIINDSVKIVWKICNEFGYYSPEFDNNMKFTFLPDYPSIFNQDSFVKYIIIQCFSYGFRLQLSKKTIWFLSRWLNLNFFVNLARIFFRIKI